MNITTELPSAHKPAVSKKEVKHTTCEYKKPKEVKKYVHKKNSNKGGLI